MSKYYKAEDVIRKRAEDLADTSYWEYGNPKKEYDQYYEGDDKPDLWEDENHRIRLVRDFGWSCYEGRDSYCNDCPAKKWCIEWEGADDDRI